MQGKVKLTKRQIKEDKFTTFMLVTKDRVQENWQYYVIGLLALLLVVVGAVYLVNSSKEKEQEAAILLANAQAEYRAGQNDVAMLSLNQVIDDFDGTSASEQAIFQLARMNFDIKNYPEAQRYFEQFLAKVTDDQFSRAASLGGLAAVFENRSEFAEAATTYVEAAEEYLRGPLEAEFRFDAMRNYLVSGDIESARTQLDILKDGYAATIVYNRAAIFFAEKFAHSDSL